jgi:alkaline phosphatase D
MIPIRWLIAFVLLVLAAGCAGRRQDAGAPLTRIAFGSCINTNSHPMLERVLRTDFNLFVLLGDNIYADTTNAAVMQRKYAALKHSPFFRRLRAKAPVLATWDDHDYGANDAGVEYPMKVESQRLFHDFMDEPADSPRRRREGVYDARVFGSPGQRVQVILLDVRYFRSMLSTGLTEVVPSGGKYIPNPDPNATMLGEAQWAWLEEQLRVPAELRIIGTGIQFISEFSGGEAWANLPLEKQRMLDLLAKTRANGVIFISGDRHWAELSRLDRPGDYPLYDLTSSALTQKHKRGTPTPNKYRADPRTYHFANVGLIRIDWKLTGPAVTLQLLDVAGRVRIEQRIDRLTR